MAIDLHTHSTFSDGSDAPATLVTKAVQAGLTAVALTDHDTLGGLDEAEEAARAYGSIELVRGVELSLEFQPGNMHMVVLDLAPEGPLQDRLEEVRRSRASRNERIVERLQELGVDIRFDEVLAVAGDEGVVGRPHIAQVLVDHGIVPDIKAAFDTFLAKGRPAYVERMRLRPDEGCRLAREAGAIPVLAHPHTLGLDRAEEHAMLYRELREHGLVGLECYYGDYTPEERERLARVARAHGLVPSGGSDYHGTFKAGLQIGRGRGDLVVPDEVLEELRAAATV